MDLQFFAEPDNGTGATGGNGSGTGMAGDPSTDPGNGNQEPVTFDDFLKSGENQSEFDRRIQKAVQTAVTNAQEKWKALTDNKLSEAEKLAKMTSAEKTEYQKQQLEKKLAEYERKETLSDMSKTARKILTDKKINIPDEILANLVTEDAEATKASVETFAKLFDDAVQDALKKALKGQTPQGSASGTTYTKDQIVAIKNTAERKRLIAENIELFQ